MPAELIRTVGGIYGQVFVLIEGKVNKTSTMTMDRPMVINCASDGSVVLTRDSGTSDTIAMIQGQSYGCANIQTATVSSGTFHYM